MSPRNGGSTWNQVRLPGTVGDLEAAHGVVYAAVRGSDSRERIYRTPASSDQWSLVTGLAAGPVLPSGGLPGPGTITLHGSAAWIFIGGHLYATQTGHQLGPGTRALRGFQGWTASPPMTRSR